MSQNQVFCPSCGAAVTPGAQFCQTCGKPIPAGLQCPKCGSAHSPGARFCPVCGTAIGAAGVTPGGVPQPAAPPRGLPLTTPPTVPPPPMPRPGAAPAASRKGSPTLPFVIGGLALVCICLVCGIGGLAIMIPPGSGGGTKQDLKLTPLVRQPLKPSSEAQTVSYEDKVRVTVPGGLLKSEQTLTISAVGNPPPLRNPALKLGYVYDISLGDLKILDQPVRLELAYDPAWIPADVLAEDQLSLMSWDETKRVWQRESMKIDAARKMLVTEVSHFSVSGQTYCDSPNYECWETSKYPHFRLMWRKDANYPSGRRYTSDPTLVKKEYVEPVAEALESAYNKYSALRTNVRMNGVPAMGPTLFDETWHTYEHECKKIDVVIGAGSWFGADEGSYSPFWDVIFLSNDLEPIPFLQEVSAHEFFHIIQVQLGIGTSSLQRNIWFGDAQAEYAAGRIAYARDSDQGKQMSSIVPPEFLKEPITIPIFGGGGVNENHHYKVSHFLDYLLNSGDPPATPGMTPTEKFVEIWNRMTKAPDSYALDVLNDWAKFNLNSAFRNFAAYFLFNTNSPMRDKPKRVPSGAISDLCSLDLNVTETTCGPISIKPNYSAGVWQVTILVGSKTQPRSAAVEPLEAVDGVSINVYVLPKNERQNLGQWGSPKPVCEATKGKPCLVSRTMDENILYVVAANTGTRDRDVSVKVSSSEVKPPFTPTPLGPCKCICPGGWPLVALPSEFLYPPLSSSEEGNRKWEECFDEWQKKCGCPPRIDPASSACMASCCFRP